MSSVAAMEAIDDPNETATRRPSTFINAIVLGNVGAGKSAVLNSLIGHPVLPTGENGATQAPIVVNLHRDPGLSSNSIVLQIDSSSLRHSLQDRLSKGASSGSWRTQSNEIYLKLRTSTDGQLLMVVAGYLFLCVSEDNIKGLPCFQNETLITIKAPHGTTLIVPDPDEMINVWGYQLVSNMGRFGILSKKEEKEKKKEKHGSNDALPALLQSRALMAEHSRELEMGWWSLARSLALV